MRAPVVSDKPIAATTPTRISVKDVNAFYGQKQALFDVNLEIPDNAVTAFIGASGCGKSTLLRCLNRMNDTIPGARVDGAIRMDGIDINSPAVDPVQVRTRIGIFTRGYTTIRNNLLDQFTLKKSHTHPMNLPRHLFISMIFITMIGTPIRMDGKIQKYTICV